MTHEPETSDTIDDTSYYLSNKPLRRTNYVLPEKRKRKFQDGTSRSQPRKALKGLIKKVQEVYKYAPLAEGEDIRVLIVEKGRRPDPMSTDDGDPLRCKLVPSALPSASGKLQLTKVIRYEALSYHWGEEDPAYSITLLKHHPSAPLGVEQKKFWIRPNLYDALVQLRSADRDIALWVDAICINQNDPDEKTAQVSKMHEIYSKADSICIWLAVSETERGSNRRTFDFIRQILNLRRLDQLIISENYVKEWIAFVELMRNRWFSRRWVVQELALAKEATVHCGEEVIQWTDFRDAVALFVTKHDQVKALLTKSPVSTELDPVGDMRALGANTLVEATNNLFRRSDNGEILERLLSLETLVSTLLAFEAKDPRDTVYAVLSIAKDTPYSDFTTVKEHRITPNYDKTLAELCTDFIDYCVEKSGSLDIICRYWAPVAKGEWAELWKDEYMPTWVSLISRSAFGEPEAALQGRSNGDSFVGTSSRQHHKNYNASASLPPEAKFGPSPDSNISRGGHDGNPIDERTYGTTYRQGGHTGTPGPSRLTSNSNVKRCNSVLFAKGMILDTIGKLSPRAAQGMLVQESLEMGGWSNDIALEKVPDSLWRTLVADRGPHETSAPSWYYRACLECLTHVTQNGDLNTDALIKDPSTPSTMVTFLNRVQQVVWNRKFLRSRRERLPEELFGLSPSNAQEGDYICILFGCSVPVILREHEAAEGPFFTFVGEAYVHGVMDGEAVSKVVPKHPYNDYKTFQIR